MHFGLTTWRCLWTKLFLAGPPKFQRTQRSSVEELLERYGRVRFEQLLEWSWDNGIAVLPLQDPGEFHGACWSIDGRVVVVLKQVTPWSSRWTFDLGHELGHVARHLNDKTLSVIELGEIAPASDDDDEQEASDFAGELMLGDADALARELAERTQGRLQRLKAELVTIAAERGVEVDALANHLAHRLSREGENWWSTAAKLQDQSSNPAGQAREMLLARSDLSRLTNEDAALLREALRWDEDE